MCSLHTSLIGVMYYTMYYAIVTCSIAYEILKWIRVKPLLSSYAHYSSFIILFYDYTSPSDFHKALVSAVRERFPN